MGDAARFILGVLLVAVAVTVAASVAGWWLAPARRAARSLRRRLGGRADAVAVSPEAARGIGVSSAQMAVALIRFAGDPGLIYPLATLRGAELLLDGEVKARAFRGEARRPLDRNDPGAEGRVTLRVIFDDPADPAFDLDLWRPDAKLRPGWTAEAALHEARALYARLEAAVTVPGLGIAREH